MSDFLHERLTRSLLEEMASGMYRDGQRFLSVRAIERLWKVSEPTIVTSLRKLVEQGLLIPRPRRGYFLGPDFRQKAHILLKRNRVSRLDPPQTFQQKARLLQNIRGGRIAVLLEVPPDRATATEAYTSIPQGLSPSVLRCAKAFESECRKYQFEPLWFLYGGERTSAEWIRQQLEVGGVNGAAAFCRSSHRVVQPMLDPIMKRQLPVVIMYEDCQGLPVNSINLNNVGAGYDAIRHLYKAGHRKIAVLIRRSPLKPHQDRLRGAMLAKSQGGCADADIEVIHFSLAKQTAQNLRLIFRDPERRPSAIFACESRCLREVSLLVDELGLSIPEDLSIIICSSRRTFRELPVPIDTMNLNAGARIGRLAAHQLHGIQTGKALEKMILIDVAYVRRGSVRIV